MEKLTSRKNEYIRHLRSLASDRTYRAQRGEFICDGMKLLKEALCFNAAVTSVLWKGAAESLDGLECEAQFAADGDLFDYASPMKNSPGPLFTVKIPVQDHDTAIKNAIVLETVQDPGNVGTVIRTANAFGISAVILTGECADLYNPKTVRSTMGAIFRQRVLTLDTEKLKELLEKNSLPLYGAALHRDSALLTALDVKRSAIAVGSEGKGLSETLLSLCDKTVFIPMQPDSESLNAAVAASVIMWEMAR